MENKEPLRLAVLVAVVIVEVVLCSVIGMDIVIRCFDYVRRELMKLGNQE
jgi:hypothetical protein